MKITKTIMKPVEVIDTDLIKVGDRLRLKQVKYDVLGFSNWFEIEVLEVNDDYLTVKLNGVVCDCTLDKLKDYEIEKVEEHKLNKFKVGERYKIEDKLSGDTYNAKVIAIDKEMVLKRDSGKYTIVQESQIDNTLMFTKIESDEEIVSKVDEIYNRLVNKNKLKELKPKTDWNKEILNF